MFTKLIKININVCLCTLQLIINFIIINNSKLYYCTDIN